MKRILVLYKELAGYFIACLDELCRSNNLTADVVAYPVHADAPFQFEHSNRIQIISRHSISDIQLIQMIRQHEYSLIFSGGWFDKGYLKAVGTRTCPAILGFDNAWSGSLKQQLSAIYGRMFIRPLFDYAFVPGTRQLLFAGKLGFEEKQIIGGAYSCDVEKFTLVRLQQQPKNRLIYAGRYSEEKFTLPLFEVFHTLAETEFPNWELHCIGTGPLWDQRKMSEHIIHHGFMQPNAMLEFMQMGNAFVLPSTFEPWGVVVHEFAAAAYPLVLSDAVGAAEAFLKEGINGYLFQAGNKQQLQYALRRLMAHTPEELESMGASSRALAGSITPKTWAASIARIIQ
ncbi:MAG: glycosyltransferase family 4 protein [Flavobacteriales bacterium]